MGDDEKKISEEKPADAQPEEKSAEKEDTPEAVEIAPEELKENAVIDEKVEKIVNELVLEDPNKKKDTTVITAEQLEMMRKYHIGYARMLKKKAYFEVQKIIDAKRKKKRRDKNRDSKRARKIRRQSGG